MSSRARASIVARIASASAGACGTAPVACALDERRLQDDEVRDLSELLGQRGQRLLAPLQRGAARGGEQLDLVAELLDALAPFVKVGARAPPRRPARAWRARGGSCAPGRARGRPSRTPAGSVTRSTSGSGRSMRLPAARASAAARAVAGCSWASARSTIGRDGIVGRDRPQRRDQDVGVPQGPGGLEGAAQLAGDARRGACGRGRGAAATRARARAGPTCGSRAAPPRARARRGGPCRVPSR